MDKREPLQGRILEMSEAGTGLVKVSLRVDSSPPFAFEPGQHLVLLLPAGDHTEKYYYSIASPPRTGSTLELLIGYRETDARTRALIEYLESEKTILLEGPFGHFHLPAERNPDLWFIATGTGISPLRSMILHLLDKPKAHETIHLVVGAGEEKRLPFHSEFKALAERYPHFHYRPVLSRETWSGHHGRVHPVYTQGIDPKTAEVFICGNAEMVEETVMNLKEMGMEEARMHFERHG